VFEVSSLSDCICHQACLSACLTVVLLVTVPFTVMLTSLSVYCPVSLWRVRAIVTLGCYAWLAAYLFNLTIFTRFYAAAYVYIMG